MLTLLADTSFLPDKAREELAEVATPRCYIYLYQLNAALDRAAAADKGVGARAGSEDETDDASSVCVL